jgi:phytoene dehydrogenase-like protein
MPDAVVVGAGPNGLVGANLLADAGWDVEVLEAEPEPGGAVRSGEIARPGFVHDRFSSFYPLGAASPHMVAMDLEAHGVRWRRHPIAVAHPAADGSAAYVAAGLDETCASMEAFAEGDGDRWRAFHGLWERVGDALLESLLSPFPPVRGAAKLVRALGSADAVLDFARLGVLPVRRLAEEEFRGAGAARLIAGNALHADFAPESPGGGIYGLVMCGLAQQVGFPVPEGGARSLTAALVRRLEARGGRVHCGERVTEVVVAGGRASAVRTAAGREVAVSRAVLADVGAPQLYRDLLAGVPLPPRLDAALRRFQYDQGTVRVAWALSAPVPWLAEPVRRAATVHIAEGVDALTGTMAEIARGLVPAHPFLVSGQYALADPTRQPAGCETFWGYAHVPRAVRGDAGGEEIAGRWDERDRERFADRMEREVEAVAPGFRDRILAREVAAPPQLEAMNANLVGGAINGGTAQLHQQLVFRPVPGLARADTPVPGLYLASASAHPGGGVHGACGANAARAALRERGPARRATAALSRAVAGRGRP